MNIIQRELWKVIYDLLWRRAFGEAVENDRDEHARATNARLAAAHGRPNFIVSRLGLVPGVHVLPRHAPTTNGFLTRRARRGAWVTHELTGLPSRTAPTQRLKLAWHSRSRRRPYLAVGWLWYLGTLVPVIGLVQVGRQALADDVAQREGDPAIGEMIAEHRGVVDAVAEPQALQHPGAALPHLAECTVSELRRHLDVFVGGERIEQIVQRTRDGGAEIVQLLGTGSAYFAPSASVLQMVDSILLDKKMIMPCAVYLQGEYGITDLFVGVPAKLGAQGVEQVIEIELNENERGLLQKSANAVKELVGVMGI